MYNGGRVEGGGGGRRGRGVTSENTLGNESLFKIDDKKDTKTGLANVIQVYLLAWSIIVNLVTGSVLSKVSGLYYK